MRRLSVRRGGGVGEVFLVTLGLAAGIVAGFGLRGLIGRLDRQRMREAVAALTGSHPAQATGRAVGRRIEAALSADPALAGLELETVPVGPGRLELHGRVPTRSLRAHAIRLAATAAAPETEVVNRLLVPEDDQSPAEPAAPGAA